MIVDWTDTSSLIAVQWLRFGSWEGDDRSYQIRNIRNPTKQAESCINNVGSFYCSSLEEEYIGERDWARKTDLSVLLRSELGREQ